MKKSTLRRWLSLLLAVVLVFSLSSAALAADGGEAEGGESEGDPPATDNENTDNGPVTNLILTGNQDLLSGSETDYRITLSNGSTGGSRITAELRPDDSTTANIAVSWVSEDTSVVQVTPQNNGRVGNLIAAKPGSTTVRVTAGNQTKTIAVTVSGVTLADGAPFTYDSNNTPTVSVDENGTIRLLPREAYFLFGDAESAYPDSSASGNASVEAAAAKSTIVRVRASKEGITIQGLQAGRDRVVLTVTAGSATWTTEFFVEVTAKEQTIEVDGISVVNPLRFSTLESRIAALCQEAIQDGENSLRSVTGLSVSTDQGTLYLNYKSSDDTGSGVGSALTYYASTEKQGPYIKDITFVPNPSFTESKATITFTATSQGGDTFRGKITVGLLEATTNITLSASPESPAKFTGSAFGEVCRQQTGAPLSYVIFTLPPASQGILYEGYVSDTDYAARVTATNQYNQTALNNLTFVPTPGYVGLVSVSYAGYSATGVRYNGEVHINVTQSLDERITYNDEGSGVVYFSEADFSAYCLNVTGGQLSYVSFTPPASSQGTLYRSWINNRGSVVTADNVFYAGQRVSAIDAITFVAVDGFSGTVRIPFSGADRRGVPFTGTVEINVQTSNAGNIAYSCTPGGSVKLSASDFNDMCLRLTGQRLHYITFQSLPDYSSGAFYHNRTSAGGMGDSVSREARYYNSSAPYIMNLSFWASDSFRGSIEVPFTGCAVSGETFSSILVITSSTSVGGSNTVTYATDGRTPVTFAAADFDAVSRAATNSALNYLRFNLPSSGEGILYFDYNPNVTPVAISSTDSLYQSGDATVSKVTFLPAYGYSGTVYIPFSGWAISGAQFQGTVAITVRGGATDTTVRYATRGEPVTFSSYAFQGAGGNQLVSIRLEALPSEEEGKLYYQYTCPGKYSWMAAVGTDYRLTGDPLISSLTFVPKAGFSGLVTIPYTASNADGTSFVGQIGITVEPVTSSAYFNDLGYASAETAAAVDYLYCCGVVGGVSPGRFAPDQTIRRGDFCLMLYRAFQFTADGTAPHFIDVPNDSYYAQAIQVLRTLGIVNGTGGNRFEPSADISRQDAALIIQRALRAAGVAAPDGAASLLGYFSDGAATSDYAQGAMACLIELELLPSAWSSMLSARTALSRADMAVMLHRAMTK